MHYYGQKDRPKDIIFEKDLIIDKKGSLDKSKNPTPLVCLSLNGTLLKKINYSEGLDTPKSWKIGAVEVECSSDGFIQKHILLQRPGAADFIVELNKYAETVIYSSQKLDFIAESLLQLSIAQGDPDFCSEKELTRGAAYMDLGMWGQDQCMNKSGVYMKSLGVLSDYVDTQISDTWLIDHKPGLVDFPCHVVTLPEFKGDPEDRELYKLADRIFIN